eukprot:gene7281-11599_t
MTIDDLIQVGHQIGINLYDLNILKVPKNATKEEKKLIENLENIRRQREIKAKLNRFRGEINSDKVKTEQERNDKNIDEAANNLKQKPRYIPDRTNTKKREKKELIGEKKIKNTLNDEQVQGMRKKPKKSNPYMEHVKEFRLKNKGKYDNKEMIRQAGISWGALQGGCDCVQVEGGSENASDNRRMN